MTHVVTTYHAAPEQLARFTSWLMRSSRTHQLLPGMDREIVPSTIMQFGDPSLFGTCIAIGVGVAILTRDRRLAAVCIVGPVLAEIITQAILKKVIDRSYFVWFSFPSGHTTAGAALATMAIVILHRQFGARVALLFAPLFAVMALAVGLSMVIMGHHDIADVIAGLAIGSGVVALVGALGLGPIPDATTNGA